MLHWLPVFRMWHLVARPLWRSLAANLKHQSSLNDSPGDSLWFVAIQENSHIWFNCSGNEKEQRLRQNNYYRLDYIIFLTPGKAAWGISFFPILFITVTGKDTTRFLTTGVLVEQLAVLQPRTFRPHSSRKLSFTYSMAFFHHSLTGP